MLKLRLTGTIPLKDSVLLVTIAILVSCGSNKDKNNNNVVISKTELTVSELDVSSDSLGRLINTAWQFYAQNYWSSKVILRDTNYFDHNPPNKDFKITDCECLRFKIIKNKKSTSIMVSSYYKSMECIPYGIPFFIGLNYTSDTIYPLYNGLTFNASTLDSFFITKKYDFEELIFRKNISVTGWLRGESIRRGLISG